MFRTNSARDVSSTGKVLIDAGGGVTLEVPTNLAEHPALYASGMRDVAGSILSGWQVYSSTSGARLSRQGATVTLALDLIRTGEGLNPRGEPEPTFAEVIPIPVGFQPIGVGFIQPAKAATNGRPGGWWDRVVTNLRIRDLDASFPTGTRITNVLSWQTIDPIPTTLPGTPA